MVLVASLGLAPAPRAAEAAALFLTPVAILLGLPGVTLLSLRPTSPRHSQTRPAAAPIFLDISFSHRSTGISGQAARRLFAPFVTSKDEGMGMGLAIRQRITEAHGGAPSAAPDPETGTVFLPGLPLLERELGHGG